MEETSQVVYMAPTAYAVEIKFEGMICQSPDGPKAGQNNYGNADEI